MTANQLHPGDSALISGFKSEIKSKARLVEMGLLPGTPVRMIKKTPLNGPVEIKVRDFYLSLRMRDALNILVKK